jgi:hypothetical protein
MFLNRFPRAFAERRGRASLNSELRFRLISRQSGRKERVSMMTGLGNHPCENKNLLSVGKEKFVLTSLATYPPIMLALKGDSGFGFR